MVKSTNKLQKTIKMLLEQHPDLKKELDSLSFVWNVSEEERRKITKRKLEICTFILEKAQKTTLIEGKITLTEEK